MPQIRLEQVSKYYQQEKKAVPAVREIDLTIEQQEFVFVTGSSGAGKSTGGSGYDDDRTTVISDWRTDV